MSRWFLLSAVLCQLGLAAEPCLKGVAACSERVPVEEGKTFTLYRTHRLDVVDLSIDSVVLVIHGVLRNANEYFEAVTTAATVDAVTSHTLILAPHFKNQEDAIEGDEISWQDDDWKRGDGEVSSFSVLDRVLYRLPISFPNLRKIVVTGHSAGGQFLSRYGVTTPLPDFFTDVEWKFIPANPSSWFYWNSSRPRPTEGCPEYDEYPYGLKNANSYVAAVGVEKILENASQRDLTVFVGEMDIETELLDQSCEAMAQGRNRFERGSLYYEMMKGEAKGLKKVVVPGLGHFGDLMYQSAEGRQILFH